MASAMIIEVSTSSTSTSTSALATFPLPYAGNVSLALTFILRAPLRAFGSLFCFNLLYLLLVHCIVKGEATGEATFSWINSSFLASNNSFGTPCGLLCALKQRSHSSLQNFGVSLSRKPVSWIWSTLISG